jgi:hypothetical protein
VPHTAESSLHAIAVLLPEGQAAPYTAILVSKFAPHVLSVCVPVEHAV